MDYYRTFEVACEGGLVTNLDVLQQGKTTIGSATTLINFEPHDGGGYKRVMGYTKYTPDAVPGTGPVLGLGIVNDVVVACRDTAVYKNVLGTWTAINGADTRTGAGFYRSIQYNFTGTEVICFVDGVNKPFKYDGTTYNVLTNAPTGTSSISVFKNHLFCAKGNQLTFSAPAEDNIFDGTQGSGQINVGDTVVGLKGFRDQLVIFCENRILRVTGNNSTDFTIGSITENLGCVSGDTIQELGGEILYLSADGLRTVSGTDKIGDYNLSALSNQIRPTIVEMTRRNPRLVSCAIRNKSQYRLLGYRSNDNFLDHTGVIAGYVARAGNTSIEFSQCQGFKASTVTSAYISNGDELVLMGNDTGYVYQLESGNTLDGTTMTAIYQTPYFSMDDVNMRKTFYKLHMYIAPDGNYNFTSNLLLDYQDRDIIQPSSETVSDTQSGATTYGVAVYGSAVYGGTLTPSTIVYLVGAGKAGAFRFVTQNALPAFAIKSLSIEYGLGGRR